MKHTKQLNVAPNTVKSVFKRELLERVLFRLATCDSDDQLENAVIKFLAPVLLKITSSNESVRCKVMEVLTHVNKRLKSRPLVQLPVEQLLVQYNATDSSFLHNFSIIYITMGFPRLSVEKQTELATILLNCLEGKPEIHQDKLLMLVLPLLGAIKIPEDPEKRGTLLGLADKPLTKKQLINLLQDVILLPYGVTSGQTTSGDVPPGMSPYSFKRVIANNWKAEELEQLKKGICRFICAGVFPDADILPLLVLASADTRYSVATPAIAELSKVNSSLDWTDANLSAPFYTLFLGNASKILDRKTTPCSARVRQKLLQYLLKSRGKGINTVRGIQIIFEALFGENTNQKCKVLALQFTENLIKEGALDLINKISKVILTGVTKLIGTESTEPFDVQNGAYGVIAQLARVCPDSFNKDLQLVVSYFTHLSVAPSELHGSIRDALIAIAPAFSWNYECKEQTPITSKFVLNANQNLLLALLAEHTESKLGIVQNVASVFLTTCFPEHFVPARYLLLLIAGERSSLRETVTTYLYGVTRTDHINYAYISSIDHVETRQEQDQDKSKLSPEQRRVVLPSFKEMVNYVHEQMEKRASNSSQKHVYGKVTLSCTYETYTEILDYIRLCLWYSSGAKAVPGDPKSTQKLINYIGNEPSNSVEINKYLTLVKQILYAKRGKVELACLYDLLNASPNTLAKECLDLKESFMLGLKDVSDHTRILVAQSQGVLIANGKDEVEFNNEVTDIIATLSQRTLEHRHGSILTLSHAFQRRIKSLKSESNFDEKKMQSWDVLKRAVILLVALLSEQQPLLISAAIKGISLIGSATILPLSDSDSSSGSESMEVDDEISVSKSSLVSTVFRLLKSAHTKAKIREDAAICLGYLAVGDGKYFAASNLKSFLEIVKLSKDTALNIAIAQGIVLTIAGQENVYDDESMSAENPFCDDKTLTDFINGVIGFVTDPNPCSRNSTAIWLLALVKNFSNRPSIYTRKQLLQFAFTELLSDDSEFIQDVASRGLGLVFSLSDQSGQSDLANSLLDQLIGGRRQVNQVNEDSKIFEEGVLGKTPTGGNITTYKELCSLASDLNQPEMIYKFMQLANHNAAWNSKLGAAFGLKSISKGAKEQMQPFLGKIVPRLYRYKYDPTPKIQNSMISIWDSIVSDSKETVEKFYWEIFDELTTNLTHVEWRVRIACCLAIRDLIKRPSGLRLKYDDRAIANKMDVDSSDEVTKMETDETEIPEPEIAKLWSQLFRVMDDVHEGTRLAAEGTAKTLSKICVVAASSNGKSAQIVASSILPLILETGVIHTVPEIRKLSMKTLSELVDSSGSILKDHLHTLVPCLLKATGELEVPKLSYLSTRLGANVEAQEAVDNIRAEAAKQHHSMETLVKCIRHIHFEALEKMTAEVTELMKSTVNLGTKIACAHFVCLITVRFNKEMTPLASKYLSVCFSGLKDRNTTVRKYSASAIGHLIGVAKEQSIIRLFAKLTEFYFENQSNKGVPYAVSAINKRHQDILKDYPSHILPLIFFAMHEEINEENRSNVELWKELWIEVSIGDAGIRMNLDSIIPMLEKSLEDQSWLIKAQSANAITTIASRLGTNLGHVERERLISCLLVNIPGRTFQGKERLLQAVSSLCKDLKKDESSNYTTIIDAIMKECRKEEPLYRTHALKAIGDILEQLNEDRFEEIYNMIWYLMDKKDLAAVTGDDEDKNLSADERNKRAMVVINLKETVCVTLGKAWPNEEKTQEKYQMMFVEQCVRCLKNNTRPVQLSVLIALGKFLDRLKILEAPDANIDENQEKKKKVEASESLQKICQDVLSAVVYVAGIPHTGLKKEALNIVLILVKRLIDIKSQTELTMVKKTFEEILVILQKDSAPEIKCRINDIEEKLKSI